MRGGYNPTRRNRNIGTKAQGHGRNNQFSIPQICHAERTWWEQIGAYRFSQSRIHGRITSFITEETNSEFIHACSIADVSRVLDAIPAKDLEGMETFVFRQSTAKQRTIVPVWGRMAYFAEIGRPARPDIKSGPAIFLEAQCPSALLKWSKSLGPDDTREIERLMADGHVLHDRGKYWEFKSSPDAIRVTQLYRTLLHEIGRWVDWLEKVVIPAAGNFDVEASLSEQYFARPKNERETFAHSYAEAQALSLRRRKIIPFPRS